MKNEFFYEPNCVEDGEWIPEKKTFEDELVLDLRFIWNLRYNLERRWIQQRLLGDAAAIWRFKRQQREERKKIVREIRAYRSNRELAPELLQILESWYLQNRKNRADIAFAVKYLLTASWAEDPSRFRNAQTWEQNLQTDTEKLWRT